ncbi:MAG: hypothetical protein Q8P41_19375 [Pseudomonadota bacterium]|nr:hypothetical protein [Pseudomonadota bacterium]
MLAAPGSASEQAAEGALPVAENAAQAAENAAQAAKAVAQAAAAARLAAAKSAWPADGFDHDPAADPDPARAPRLAPVQRPVPSFEHVPVVVAVAPPNPVLAALISAILPGAGQIYAGQTVKGVLLLVVAFFTCFGGGLFNVLAAVDALLIAQRKARGEVVGDWQFF